MVIRKSGFPSKFFSNGKSTFLKKTRPITSKFPSPLIFSTLAFFVWIIILI